MRTWKEEHEREDAITRYKIRPAYCGLCKGVGEVNGSCYL